LILLQYPFLSSLQNFLFLQPEDLARNLYEAFAASISSRIDTSDFICTLAIIRTEDVSKKLRFLFRVYGYDTSQSLSRNYVTKILEKAYNGLGKEREIHNQIQEIFGSSATKDHRELLGYQGSLDLLMNWINILLSVFLKPLPRRLMLLENKYSQTQEVKRLLRNHAVDDTVGNQLKTLL